MTHAQTIRALADRAADVEAIVGDSITHVQMGEMADGSHRWHALVTVQDEAGLEQVFRITTPALGDNVPRWARHYMQWGFEVRAGDDWLVLDEDGEEELVCSVCGTRVMELTSDVDGSTEHVCPQHGSIGQRRYFVDDVQACEPSELPKVEGIEVVIADELDSMGFERVTVYGPTREAVIEYVRQGWGDDDSDWFKEWVVDRVQVAS